MITEASVEEFELALVDAAVAIFAPETKAIDSFIHYIFQSFENFFIFKVGAFDLCVAL